MEFPAREISTAGIQVSRLRPGNFCFIVPRRPVGGRRPALPAEGTKGPYAGRTSGRLSHRLAEDYDLSAAFVPLPAAATFGGEKRRSPGHPYRRSGPTNFRVISASHAGKFIALCFAIRSSADLSAFPPSLFRVPEHTTKARLPVIPC